MAEIIPAILSESFVEIKNQLERVEGAVTWAQIDVADGIFVPNHTWDRPADLKEVNGKTKLEIHLMVDQPEQIFRDWLDVADRLLIHPESTTDLEIIIEAVAATAVKVGLALLVDTPLESIKPFVDKVAVVQLMGIAGVGEQGQPFDEQVLERVKTLRVMYPSVKISVDGGVNLNNAGQLVEAGADALIVGSAIWRMPDPLLALQQFNNAIVRRQT